MKQPSAYRHVDSLRVMSWSTRLEYAKVIALGVVVEILLRLVPLDRVARVLKVALDSTALDSRPPVSRLPRWAVRRFVIVKRTFSKWPVDGACLRESLVLGHRLRLLEPVLRIGVAKREGKVAAHAWLEISGMSLDPTSLTFEQLELAP